MPLPPEFEYAKLRAEANARVPAHVRNARLFGGGFEERAVKRVCAWLGQPLGPLYDSRKHRGDANLSFAHFRAVVPLPVALFAGRLKFEYSGIAAELFNDFEKSPMWSAYLEARAAWPDGPLGVVFSWPGIKKCRGYMVLHDVAGLPAQAEATSLQREVRDVTYTIESVPALLAGLRLIADVEDDPDGEETEG